NSWSHLAETYDGSMLRLYVNGTQVAAVARTGSIASSGNPLQIGGDNLYGQNFQGIIDEVRVYNVALTPTQIQSDMGAPVGGSLPVVTLSASSLDFGSQPTGITTSAQTVTVTNVGGAPLTIASSVVDGVNAGDFAEMTTCGATLAPSTSCSVDV